jgi:ABC-type sugar transport system permease subunit
VTAIPQSQLPARRRPARYGRALFRDRTTTVLFLAIPLVIYAVWVWGPMLATIVLSFTRWNTVTAPRWVGIENYQELFCCDLIFRQALVNNGIWLAVFLTLPLSWGLALAVVLDRKIRFTRLYQGAFYFPLVLSTAVVGLIFNWFFLPRAGTSNEVGLVNEVLGAITGGTLQPGWAGNENLGSIPILAAAVWRQTGYVMVLYLAGLKGIDPAMREAAAIDGASEWKVFRKVTLPLLKPVTVIVLVISIIEALRSFDLVYVMTNQLEGPAFTTSVLATHMFNLFSHQFEGGQGAAVACVLLVISLAFIVTYMIRVIRTEEDLA